MKTSDLGNNTAEPDWRQLVEDALSNGTPLFLKPIQLGHGKLRSEWPASYTNEDEFRKTSNGAAAIMSHYLNWNNDEDDIHFPGFEADFFDPMSPESLFDSRYEFEGLNRCTSSLTSTLASELELLAHTPATPADNNLWEKRLTMVRDTFSSEDHKHRPASIEHQYVACTSDIDERKSVFTPSPAHCDEGFEARPETRPSASTTRYPASKNETNEANSVVSWCPPSIVSSEYRDRERPMTPHTFSEKLQNESFTLKRYILPSLRVNPRSVNERTDRDPAPNLDKTETTPLSSQNTQGPCTPRLAHVTHTTTSPFVRHWVYQVHEIVPNTQQRSDMPDSYTDLGYTIPELRGLG